MASYKRRALKRFSKAYSYSRKAIYMPRKRYGRNAKRRQSPMSLFKNPIVLIILGYLGYKQFIQK